VLEDRDEEFSCEGESTAMKWWDACMRTEAGGWTGLKRSRSCSQCRVLEWVKKIQLSDRGEAINW